MDSDRGQYPVSQSEIDPRLQETTSTSQPYSDAPAPAGASNPFRLPPPPPQSFQQQHEHGRQHQQQQQQQPHQVQHPYGVPPPQWTPEGYNPYYASSPPVSNMPHHTTHAYHTFHDASATPSLHMQLQDASESSKRSRACEACRNLKVRCEPDLLTGTCKRCAKAGRHCIITAPSRKRQKKTDSRVAELERKIDALTQSLKSTKDGHMSGSDEDNEGEGETSQMDSLNAVRFPQPAYQASAVETGHKRNFADYRQDEYSGPYAPNPLAKTRPLHPSTAPYLTPEAQMSPMPISKPSESSQPRAVSPVIPDHIDVVGRGVLSMATANELFEQYTKDMAPHMPLVVFSKEITSHAVRKSRPLLFLAVMSVASGRQYPELHSTLNKEVMRSLIERIVEGESKTLEVIQTLQVIIIWYLPEPDKESKYFQLVHMAAGIAIDLGINKKPEAKRNKFSVLQQASPVIDIESIESRRAWVGCYLMSSSITMGMRRQNLIRSDGYLQDCMATLRDSADAAGSDAVLVQLASLQTLADDLSAQILPDYYIAISESKARNAHKGFERQMKDWHDQKDGEVSSLSPSVAFNVINLYMHELVMQHVASFESARPASRARGKPQLQAPSTQTSSSSIAVTSTIGILVTFSKFTTQEIRTLPTFYFAQLAHASVSLIKLYFVAQTDAELSKLAPVTVAMVEEHLGHLCEALRSASAKSLAAHTCLKMITTIQSLFRDHKDSSLATIKARYSGVPSLKGTQILDLGEPQPTPQQRTAAGKSGQSSDDALHVLSAVAMGKTNSGGYDGGEGRRHDADAMGSNAIDGEMATMGQLIGEQDMGFMGDDGFFGIMQQMWARSV